MTPASFRLTLRELVLHIQELLLEGWSMGAGQSETLKYFYNIQISILECHLSIYKVKIFEEIVSNIFTSENSVFLPSHHGIQTTQNLKTFEYNSSSIHPLTHPSTFYTVLESTSLQYCPSTGITSSRNVRRTELNETQWASLPLVFLRG